MARKIHRLLVAGVVMCALVLVAGCASAPPPSAELNAADAAVNTAASADADQYARAELAAARERLRQAQGAAAEGDYENARAFAAQAQADAELATAKSRVAVARAEVARKTGENERLRRELLDQEGRR